MDAAVLEHQRYATSDTPVRGIDKWETLRELSAARTRFGLSDRDLAVLQALVSFHPGTMLGADGAEAVVYPSNRAICERLNGMPSSTMRRHLAKLVQAGVILRRDSPNGKRYARCYGDEKVAFGFDLAPLLSRHAEFHAAAQAIRAEAEQLRRLRETVSLMRRDLAGLAQYGARLHPDLALWDQLSDMAVLCARDLRRKLSLTELREREAMLRDALDAARVVLDPGETVEVSTSESRSGQHHQSSQKDSSESEPASEGPENPNVAHLPQADHRPETEPPNIPLAMVLEACPDATSYAPNGIRSWQDLIRVAHIVRPMMGISPSAWDAAREVMGPQEAAVVVCAMLQRFECIRNPGGYLRRLTEKAGQGAFSCGPMVMALLRQVA